MNLVDSTCIFSVCGPHDPSIACLESIAQSFWSWGTGVPNGPGPVTWGETSDSKTRKEFISVRPTPGRQWSSVSKSVSKMLKIPPGLHKENVGQRSAGTCRWAVKVRSIIVLGSITGGLRTVIAWAVVSVPIRGCFASRLFCTSSERSWKDRNQLESLRSEWRWLNSSFVSTHRETLATTGVCLAAGPTKRMQFSL